MRTIPGTAILIAFLVPIGCASSGSPGGAATAGPTSDPAMAGEPGMTHGAMHEHGAMADLPATAGQGFTVSDVRFMQGMIGHHAQAIEMSELAPTHGAGTDVSKLANKIDISQTDEIEFMAKWLRDRGQAVPTDAQVQAMRMPGMLSPEQMAQLDAARGPDFDRLFLTFMIEHHWGAIEMVDALFDDPLAGQDVEIFQFATDVETDQRNEIYVMQMLLAAMQHSNQF